MRRRFDLTDFEWSIIEPLLPNKSRGVPRVDDRRVINGILWRFRTGSPWADIPERYGPYTTCYNRFVRWRKAGVWDRLLEAVSAAFEGDLQMIDSSCVRVHHHGATPKKGDPNRCMGRSRGGLTTKIHALVDAEGRPVRLHLSEGQSSDCVNAEALLDLLSQDTILLADKGYDTDSIRARIQSAGAFANIPAKSNRKQAFPFSAFLYRYRNLVERFFGKIKNARGLATRYDKRADNFLAALKLFSARLWIRSYESTP
ncbi:IS5 family transposase, partial [Pelagibacterium mangrovi]|uniref:IS5 family transposase n=1 Tax=Pelagibacterium mangrovi TaxID=3119828 RepID=UPI002FCC03A6